LAQLTNVTDRQTDTAGDGIASRGKNYTYWRRAARASRGFY